MTRQHALTAAITVATATTALALAACATSPRAVARAPESGGPRWTTTLSPAASPPTPAREVAVAGTATITPGDTSDTFLATVTITGEPGGSYAWHVHVGECGSDRGLAGELTAYPAVTLGRDGTGTATATVPFGFPTDGHFFVDVHPSASDPQTVLACGNLKRED